MTAFQGLSDHGGYPPMAADGEEPAQGSANVNLVDYPNQASLDGLARHAFATLLSGELFCVSPEVLHPSYVPCLSVHIQPSQSQTNLSPQPACRHSAFELRQLGR